MKKISVILVLGLSLCLQSFLGNAANYYWINGSGNWSDLSHWATSSGGSTLHTQIPTALDDVFFDANSFALAGQTVTMDGNPSLCHSMDWTGALNNPTLAGISTNTLKIYGSLTLINAMNIGFQGYLNFEATTVGNLIRTNGKQLNNDVYFIGNNGGWILMDSLYIAGSHNLFFLYGNLNTNSQNVHTYRFISDQTNTRTLTLGSSIINIRYPSNYLACNIYTSNLTLNAGTSKIRFTGGSGVSSGGMYIYDSYTGITSTFYDVEFLYPTGTSVLFSEGSGQTIFHNVTYYGSGELRGTNTFNDLNLTGGKNYQIMNGKTQTIINALNLLNPSCMAVTSIQSLTNGSFGTFSKGSGSITIDYVVLRDVHAAGGAVFTANNATDLGNNTGWVINPSVARTLYWVGGSGNWNDQNHWSLTSGGAGPQCIPSPTDDVFFDANSFSAGGQSVNINVSNATCRDMRWTGALYNPSITGVNTNIIKIYGSLELINAMSIPFQGNINFESTTIGKTITTAGQQLSNNIYFMGNNGGWTLMDSLYIAGSFNLFFYYGNFNTNSKNIHTYRFISDQTNVRALTLGSSVINIRYPSNYLACNIYTSNLTLNAGTSKIRFTGGSGVSSGGMYIYDSYTGITSTFYDVEFLYPTGTSVLFSEGSGQTIFHTVTYYGSGEIRGTNTFNDLNLTGGKNYQIMNGKTQTIINALNLLNPSCMAVTSIQSLTNGSFGTFSKSSGSVTIDYVVLRDIHAAGGAVFTANNATDLGNNNGWIINPSVARSLYWVGGSGDWNDQNHWSLTSGGSGPQCIPSPADDVYFDANSFSGAGQTVNINVSNATCRDMRWNGALYTPAMGGTNTNTLKIYGSLELINAMSIPFQGNINFESTTTGKTIRTSGKQLSNNIYFMGNNGGWTLMDSLYIAGSFNLYFYYGNFNTNNKNIHTYRFISDQTNLRVLTLGSSVINIRYPSNYLACNIYTSNLTLNAGTSKIRFTGGSGVTGGGMYIYDSYTGITATLYDVEFLYPSGTATLFSEGSGQTIFHNVSFYGGGDLRGTNTFNDLNFTAGNTYILASSKTQTIQHHWQVQGSCISYIVIQASTLGTFATVSQAIGAVIGYNIHMRDIHSIGGAVFNAYNSVDLGGNTGWIFGTLPPMANPASITGLTNLCAGQSGVSYSIPWVSGAISYIWSVPPGVTIVTGQGDTTITVNFSGSVSDSISVIAFNGCAGSSVSAIAVNAAPPSFAALSNVCVTQAPFALGGGTPGGGIYAGPGVTTGTFDPAVAGAGTHAITYMLSTGACADTLTQNITVIPSPSITASPANPAICDYSAIQITASGASSYSWSPATGLDFTNVSNPIANPGSSTTYTITGNNSGCTASETVTVNVITAPTVTVTPAIPSICDYESIQVTASGADFYSWTPATGLDFTNISNPTATPGTTATYTVTGTTSGCTASQTVTVNVSTSPLLSVLPAIPSICDYQSIQLTASGADTYAWTPAGDLDFTNIPNPYASPSSTATYTVTGTTSGCTASQTVTVNVNASPVLAMLPANPTICDYQSIQITASGADNYAWSPATGLDFTNIADPVATPGTTATYTVTGSTNGCTASQMITVNVNASPTLLLLPASPTICSYQSIQLTASGADSYGWSPAFGLDFTNIANPTASPGTTATYTVTGTTNGCTSSEAITVNVTPATAITILPVAPSICNSQSIQLTASGADGYSWSPATGLDLTNIANPMANPGSTTTYTVTGTTSGCTASQTVTVSINSGPTLTVSPTSPTICGTGSVQLQASGATDYSWTPATALDFANIPNPIASPGTTTTYTVTGTTAGCTSSQTITINHIPSLNLSVTPSSPAICAGDSVQLTANGATTYAWDSSPFLSDTAIANPWAFPIGTSTFHFTAIAGACSDTMSISVVVNPTPTIVVTPPADTICLGESLPLSATGASSYSWSPASGLSATGISNPTATPGASTTYTVAGSALGCIGFTTVAIHVDLLPSITFNPSAPTLCMGDSIQITAAGATSYSWSPATGLDHITISAPMASPAGTTTYTVTGSASGCSSTSTVVVTVQSNPIVTAVAVDQTICAGEQTSLNAAGATSYAWSPATSLNNGTIWNPIASPLSTTTYTVVGSTAGCSGSNTIILSVNELPLVDAVVGTESCTGANDAFINLNLSGGMAPYSILWSNGALTDALLNLAPANYLVSITDANGCATTGDYDIIASDFSCYLPHLYLPNTFSPNGDGNNDILYIRGQGISSIKMIIYNRWGEKIFETSNVSDGWDGTFRDQMVDSGVFYYSLKGEFENGEGIIKEGSITLVR